MSKQVSEEAVEWALKASFETALRGDAPAVERLLQAAQPIIEEETRSQAMEEIKEGLAQLHEDLAEWVEKNDIDREQATAGVLHRIGQIIERTLDPNWKEKING